MNPFHTDEQRPKERLKDAMCFDKAGKLVREIEYIYPAEGYDPPVLFFSKAGTHVEDHLVSMVAPSLRGQAFIYVQSDNQGNDMFFEIDWDTGLKVRRIHKNVYDRQKRAEETPETGEASPNDPKMGNKGTDNPEKDIKAGPLVRVIKPNPIDDQCNIPHHLRWQVGDEFIVQSIEVTEYGTFLHNGEGHKLDIKRAAVVDRGGECKGFKYTDGAPIVPPPPAMPTDAEQFKIPPGPEDFRGEDFPQIPHVRAASERQKELKVVRVILQNISSNNVEASIFQNHLTPILLASKTGAVIDADEMIKAVDKDGQIDYSYWSAYMLDGCHFTAGDMTAEEIFEPNFAFHDDQIFYYREIDRKSALTLCKLFHSLNNSPKFNVRKES